MFSVSKRKTYARGYNMSLLEMRIHTGMSIEQVAAASEVGVDQIQKIEQGNYAKVYAHELAQVLLVYKRNNINITEFVL